MRGSGYARLSSGVGDRAQHLVVDVDEVERLGRGLLVAGDHRRHRIADEADEVAAERMLVLADRQDAVGDREVVAGQHQVDAVEGPGPRHVDRPDARVRHRRSQQPAVHRARRQQVVGEAGLAGDLGAAVDAAPGACRPRRRGSSGCSCRPLRAAPTGRSRARQAGPPLPPPRRSGGSRCSGTGCPTAPRGSARATDSARDRAAPAR